MEKKPSLLPLDLIKRAMESASPGDRLPRDSTGKIVPAKRKLRKLSFGSK